MQSLFAICSLLGSIVVGQASGKRPISAPATGSKTATSTDDQWMAEIANQLHPQLEQYLEKQVKSKLEDKVGATLSSVIKKVIGPFQFSTFNVSSLDLEVDQIRVLKLDHESDHRKESRPIKMDVGLTLNGPVDVGMALGISTIYLTEVTIKIKARATAAGPIPRPPFASGIQLSLLEKPWIDFKFSGATKFLAKQLLNVLDNVIESKMGYPNLMAMQLDPIAEPRKVRSMNPTGVLAYNIKRAKNLLDEEGFFKKLFKMAQPDTYVRSQLGTVKHETKAILHNENPVYGDEWVELPLDTLEGYSLDFSVFERSPTADVLYGTAHVHDVKAAILNKTKELDLDITLSNDFKSPESNMTKGGQLVVQLKWIHLSDEAKNEVSSISSSPELNHGGKNVGSSPAENSPKGNITKPAMFLRAKAATPQHYPSQSKQVVSLFMENLTVVEMLKPPPPDTDEKLSQIQVGGEQEGSLVPVGGLANLPLNMIVETPNNKTQAVIHKEYLFMLGKSNQTESSVAFKFTCSSLDSPLEGTLDLSSVRQPFMTVIMEDKGKTAKIKLATFVTVQHLNVTSTVDLNSKLKIEKPVNSKVTKKTV